MLYTQISDKQNLHEAWMRILKKGSGGGIDHISVKDFSKKAHSELKKLREELINGSYTPEPYKVFFIKKNETEKRKLACSSVRDKIIQSAIKQVIEPIFESLFPDTSYAYRKNKGTTKAIKRILHLKAQGYSYVVPCDIDDFFDTVDHRILFGRLSETLQDSKTVDLIKLLVLNGDVDDANRWLDRQKGIAQGGVLSPLLANYYLLPLDLFCRNSNYAYVRYADDFVLQAKSTTHAAEILESVTRLLSNDLKLSLNLGNEPVSFKQGFEFLGLTIKDDGLFISESKKQDLHASLLKHLKLDAFGKLPDKYFEAFEGIKNYYGRLLPQETLKEMDQKLIRALGIFFESEVRKGTIKTQKKIRAVGSLFSFFSDEMFSKAPELIKGIAKQSFTGHSEPDKDEKDSPFIDSPDEKLHKKKKQYEKLESAGMEIIIETPGVFIGKHYHNLVLKQDGRLKMKANAMNLKTITVLCPGVCFSSDAVHFCSKHDISIDFLGFNGKPYAMVYMPLSERHELVKLQIEASGNLKGESYLLCLIRACIKNRSNLLKYFAKYRFEKDAGFAETFDEDMLKMKALQKDVKALAGKDSDQLKTELFMIEAHAARIYWSLVAKLLDEYIEFPGRQHKGAKDRVNAMLNYAYGILYARIWKAVIRASLSPYVGFLHSDKKNVPAFIFDFIEEFRQQAVDRVIFGMISKKVPVELNEGMLSQASRTAIAENVTQRLNDFETFRGKRMRFEDIIRTQALSFADYLEGKIRTYKPYVSKW